MNSTVQQGMKTGTNILWRRRRARISNQLAVIAAIMLFASTQVSTPFGTMSGSDDATAAMVASAQSHDGAALDDLQESEDRNASVASQAVSSAKGKKRLNLSLFRFRR